MTLFACSGPGAGEIIAHNIVTSLVHAAVVGGLLAASLALFTVGPRRRIVPAILFGLFVLHPAWTISAINGDCGFLKRDASWIFTGFGTLALAVQGLCWLATTRRLKSGHKSDANGNGTSLFQAKPGRLGDVQILFCRTGRGPVT
jgi:hypothetical protein